jgi:hypothetical protein
MRGESKTVQGKKTILLLQRKLFGGFVIHVPVGEFLAGGRLRFVVGAGNRAAEAHVVGGHVISFSVTLVFQEIAPEMTQPQ